MVTAFHLIAGTRNMMKLALLEWLKCPFEWEISVEG